MSGVEMWLKLAQAHIIMGRQEKASDVLTTASKLYPDDWLVWRELSVLSGHCQNFNRMISSYHRILDLKNSYTDNNLLFELAKFIESRLSSSGTIENDLRKNSMNLFEKLVKREPENPALWALYGLVMASSEKISDQEIQKVVLNLEKSVKKCLADQHWFKNFTSVKQVLDFSQIITEVFVRTCKILKLRPEREQLFIIIINFLKKVIETVKENHTDLITGLIKAEYRSSVQCLEENLKLFEDKNYH